MHITLFKDGELVYITHGRYNLYGEIFHRADGRIIFMTEYGVWLYTAETDTLSLIIPHVTDTHLPGAGWSYQTQETTNGNPLP